MNDLDLRWVERNYPGLQKEFAGEWIVVQNCRVVAHGQTLERLSIPNDAYLEYIPTPGERAAVIINAGPIVVPENELA